MTARLTIGDFSRMTHLSVKALRHYHEQGVLEPAEVEPFTSYRFYRPDQVPVAQVIRRLRDLGMPLPEIRAVLRAPDVAARNQAIAAHLQRMESQLEQTRATVASLRALLQEPASPEPVRFRSMPATRAVAIRETITVAEFPAWWADARDELHRAAGDGAAGPGGGLYPSEVYEMERGEVVLFVPVAGAARPSGRVEEVEIPASELAVMLHRGPIDDLDRTYGALGTVVAERAIGVEGPIREYYLVSSRDTDDESRHRTEVGWPIFQTS